MHSYYTSRKFHHAALMHLCLPYNSWGLTGSRRGIGMSLQNKPPDLGHKPMYHPPTYRLQIPHISLSDTVCDRVIWVFVNWIAKSFQRHLTQQKRMHVPFEWIGTILTKYRPLGEDWWQIPLFSPTSTPGMEWNITSSGSKLVFISWPLFQAHDKL